MPGDPKSIGEILAGLKKTSRLGVHLDQAGIWEHWPKLAGQPLWMHGKPIKFKERTLYVEVESPVWMHRFATRKWTIIKRINRLARKELVSDLFFVLEPDVEAPKAQDTPQ